MDLNLDIDPIIKAIQEEIPFKEPIVFDYEIPILHVIASIFIIAFCTFIILKSFIAFV